MDARRRTRPLARAIALGPAARPSLDRFGISTDPKARAAVARVIAALATESLPGAGDVASHFTVLPSHAALVVLPW